jgi:hypothetical protein
VQWRNGGPLQNEGATPNTVTVEDYNFWRARFGATSGSGSASATAVPEPASCVLAMFTLCGTIGMGRRRRLPRT